MRWQQQNVNSFSWALPSATKSLFHYQFWTHCGWMVVQSQVLPSPLLPPPSSSFKSTKSNNRKEIRKRRERIAQGACDNNNYYNHRTVIITWICAAAPRQLLPPIPHPPVSTIFVLTFTVCYCLFIHLQFYWFIIKTAERDDDVSWFCVHFQGETHTITQILLWFLFYTMLPFLLGIVTINDQFRV